MTGQRLAPIYTRFQRSMGNGWYRGHLLKPNHEKKKTRPYTSKGFRTGIERAFRLIGLVSGADQRYETFILTVRCD